MRKVEWLRRDAPHTLCNFASRTQLPEYRALSSFTSMSNNTYENDIHSCTSSGRRPTRTTKAFDEDPAAIVEQEFWQPLLPHEVTAALQQLEDYLLHASHLKSSEKTFLCFARGQSTMAVGKRGAWTYEIDEDSLRYLTSEGFGITELAQISGGSKGCLRADLVEVD